MGVQTQINRITGEVSTQQGLIGQLKEYVDGTTTEVAVQKNLIAQIKEQADRTATEVSIQHDLIQQVKTTLKGKGAGSGQLPALTNPGTAEDLAEGKQLIGADGSVITGLLVKGFAVKTGTTTSRTIDTGLSDIEQFFIYKESQTATGLIHLHYSKDGGTSRLYASAWSTNNYGSKTITNGTGGTTVNGGTITISATQATQGGLTGNVTYKWIAVGTE